MKTSKKVCAYFDGSNFYHLLKASGNDVQVDFVRLAEAMLAEGESLTKVKYYNSPINQQDEPVSYAKQLKFFDKLKKNEMIELKLGRLVKRNIGKINIQCQNCGLAQASGVVCQKGGQVIDLGSVFKTSEKGLDVSIAIDLLLDSLESRYDAALLFSGDADFVPTIEYVIKNLSKEIVYCRFPKIRTSQLASTCSSTRIIKSDIIKSSRGGKMIVVFVLGPIFSWILFKKGEKRTGGKAEDD